MDMHVNKLRIYSKKHYQTMFRDNMEELFSFSKGGRNHSQYRSGRSEESDKRKRSSSLGQSHKEIARIGEL